MLLKLRVNEETASMELRANLILQRIFGEISDKAYSNNYLLSESEGMYLWRNYGVQTGLSVFLKNNKVDMFTILSISVNDVN